MTFRVYIFVPTFLLSFALSPTLSADPLADTTSSELDSWSDLYAELDSTEDLLSDWEKEITSTEETEPELDFLADPLTQNWFIGASLHFKAGYTSNLYQGENALAAPFFQPEADFYLTTYPTPSTVLTVFAFGEWVSYQPKDQPAEEETLAFGQIEAQWYQKRLILGTTVDVFYGDQIYDDSLGLVNTDPIGGRIRQVSTTGSLYLESSLLRIHRIRLTGLGKRTRYEEDSDNFSEFGAQLKWTTTWTKNLSSEVSYEAAFLDYDEQNIRRVSGLALSGPALEIWRHRLRGKLSWDLPFWNLTSTSRVHLEARDDNGFGYENQIRSEFGEELKFKWKDLTLRLGGRVLLVHYADRLVTSTSREILYQQKDSASFEAEYEFRKDWIISFNYEWERFRSRLDSDTYESHQTTIGLQRSF